MRTDWSFQRMREKSTKPLTNIELEMALKISPGRCGKATPKGQRMIPPKRKILALRSWELSQNSARSKPTRICTALNALFVYPYPSVSFFAGRNSDHGRSKTQKSKTFFQTTPDSDQFIGKSWEKPRPRSKFLGKGKLRPWSAVLVAWFARIGNSSDACNRPDELSNSLWVSIALRMLFCANSIFARIALQIARATIGTSEFSVFLG